MYIFPHHAYRKHHSIELYALWYHQGIKMTRNIRECNISRYGNTYQYWCHSTNSSEPRSNSSSIKKTKTTTSTGNNTQGHRCPLFYWGDIFREFSRLYRIQSWRSTVLHHHVRYRYQGRSNPPPQVHQRKFWHHHARRIDCVDGGAFSCDMDSPRTEA